MIAQVRPKQDYYEKASEDFERHLGAGGWSLRDKIALTCRILFDEHHEAALAAQILSRADKPGTYWMTTYGLGLDEIRASNVMLCDRELKVIEGEGMPPPANRSTMWIFDHRPEVTAIVHTHPPHCSALLCIGHELVPAHTDHCIFFDDVAYLKEWPGTPIGDEEGRLMHEALGTKRVLLMGHHGPLVAAGSLDEATMMLVALERAAKMQLVASAAGPIKRMNPELARQQHDYRLQPRLVEATFAYYARRALRRHPDVLD